MAKEINALIKSLLEVQQRREDNQIIMKVSNVRVVSAGRQYYAKLVISAEAVIIEADDLDIGDSYFRPVHLRGFHEVGQRAILLNLCNDGQQVVLHFRTEQQMARSLRRIRQLTGSESTSESSFEVTSPECSSAPNTSD